MKTILLAATAFCSLSLAVAGCNQKKLAAQQELPACIAAKIKEAEADPAKAKISRIERYRYKGQTVYYIVPARCYDCFSTVYTDKCVPLCSPGGGITGKGDGRCADFGTESSDKVQVWPAP